jgi:DNA-binding beta-propeller fold protein YncE
MSRRRLAVGALLAVLAAGCATSRTPTITELTWPEPPLTPRIKFVGLLRNQRDLGQTTGQLFAEALLGPKPLADSLQQPMGVTPSRDGKRLYVTDYARPGVFVFDFETQQVSMLGDALHGFRTPLGIALDAQENVYVVDSTPRMIRIFDAKGVFLRAITHDSLERPTGIAIDAARGRLYVVDSSSQQSQNHIKAFGGQGGDPGQFLFPTYVALDSQGNLYVADTLNARLQVFDPDGQYVRTIGERGDAFGMFDKPKGVALDAFNNIYVVDSGWSNVQIFNQQGQVLLFFGGRGRFPGFLFNPTGIAIDRDNRIYVADAFNGRVCVYQLINTTAEDSFPSAPSVSDEAPAPRPTHPEPS